jgi:hypothetical protein
VQSAFVVHAEPYVDAAVLPESPPVPLLDPEPPSLLASEPPELLPLDEELPEELPVAPLLLLLVLPPLLLLPPDDEEPVLDPDDPLPPELELGLMPGDV